MGSTVATGGRPVPANGLTAPGYTCTVNDSRPADTAPTLETPPTDLELDGSESSTGGLREHKKAQTRRDLIHHAVMLFQEQGYEATAVDEIAAAAGYSRRTFFHYFKTKEDVVFVDVDEFLIQLQAKLAAVPADTDPWSGAGQVLRELTLEFSGADPTTTIARNRLWFTEPALAGRYARILDAWENAVAEFFAVRQGVPLSENLDAQFRAAALMAVMRIAVRNEVLAGGNRPDQFRQAFDLLSRGAP